MVEDAEARAVVERLADLIEAFPDDERIGACPHCMVVTLWTSPGEHAAHVSACQAIAVGLELWADARARAKARK